MATTLVIVHGLVAVALLGAITHQTLASWTHPRTRPTSFFGRFRTVPPASFANAIVILYTTAFALGAIVYWYYSVDIKPTLERSGHWPTVGLFDIKEHFAAIGLALLPAYWVCWRRPWVDAPTRTRAGLTSLLAFVVWWNFLIGHVANNLMGFGS